MIYNINKNLILENATIRHLQKYAMPYSIGGILGASALYNYMNPAEPNNVVDTSGEPADNRSPAQKLYDSASEKAGEVKNQVVEKAGEVVNGPKTPESNQTPTPNSTPNNQTNAAPVPNYNPYTGELITTKFDEHEDTKKMLKVLAGVGTAGAVAAGVGAAGSLALGVAPKSVQNASNNVKTVAGNMHRDAKNYYSPDKELLSKIKEDEIKANNRELAKKMKEEKVRASEVADKINSQPVNTQPKKSTVKQSKWDEAGIPPPPPVQSAQSKPRAKKTKVNTVTPAITPVASSSPRKKLTGKQAGGR